MSPRDWLQLLGGVIIGVPTILVGLATVRQNRRGQQATNALEERKLNKEDFDSITRELRASIQGLKDDLERERARAREAEDGEERAETRAREAERRTRDAERRATAAERRAEAAERAVQECRDEVALLKEQMLRLQHELDEARTADPDQGV